MIETLFFLLFSLVCTVAALSVILQKNPVYSALSLIIVIVGLGGLFLLLKAPFIAVLQIVIYAGAIMALFLFVIMMVEVKEDPTPIWRRETKFVLLILLLIAGMAIWAVSASSGYFGPVPEAFDVKSLSRQIFTLYVFPFEAISALIIASVIGALYIARKEES